MSDQKDKINVSLPPDLMTVLRRFRYGRRVPYARVVEAALRHWLSCENGWKKAHTEEQELEHLAPR